MSELVRFPVAVPGLADVAADPGVLDDLPVETLAVLRHQLRVLEADIERAVTLRLIPVVEDDVAVLTVAAPATRGDLSGRGRGQARRDWRGRTAAGARQ